MEDLKQIQEFFSKPLNENKVTKEDFDKVVKILSKSKYPFTIMLVPKWNEIDIITGQDSPDEITDDISQRLDSAGLNWGGNSGITISGDSSNYSRREYSDIFRVNGGHKDYYEESVNEMDMNDPILMKMRAAKDKLAKMRAANAGDDGNDKFFDAAKLRALKKKRAQIMRDMEQEAEMEGGPIADKYGNMLNKIDKAISMLNEATKKEYNALLDKEHELTKAYSKDKTDANWKKLSDIRKKGKKLEKELEDQGLYVKEKKSKFKKHGEMSGFDMRGINEDNSYARVSKPRFKKDKNNPNFLNVYLDYDIGPGGNPTAFGKETMTGQIRRLSSAKARKVAHDIALDLEANFNLEDIEVTDLENGKVRIFAVSDDFIDMDPNMLSEGASTEEKRMAMQAIKRFAKYRGVSEKEAKADLLRAIKELGSIEEAINEIVETIQAGKVLEEKLCKKGEAYRKRRMAAGEKSSAYLSGRAVKVCKGQMSGKKKKK